MPDYILAIDQGTTGSRAMLCDREGRTVGRAYREFTQIYPRPGWVEHDPEEIWETTLAVVEDSLAGAGLSGRDVAAIGITNQRETTVVWDAATGQPVSNAIVWQCRRTAPICDEMRAAGMHGFVQERTGLVIDAYFSGTKLAWILDNVPHARRRADAAELRFGTIDTWLIWKLTRGGSYVTDVSNASRTMLFNIHRLDWDDDMLRHFGVSRAILPRVCPSSGVCGVTSGDLLGAEIPIAGIAGDQQAALFGQACFEPGAVKNTYGTGCFALMNTGSRPVASSRGLLTTVAWGVGGHVDYALEGSVFVAGAAIQWLRDDLKLLANAAESESVARSVPDSAGVYLVPAFVGLGAPHWDSGARGTIVGLTRGSGRAHIVRAALESIALQSLDLLEVMTEESANPLRSLQVDGGATANDFLMQCQADILDTPVERAATIESTALGAAFLAGLGVGFWSDREEVRAIRRVDRRFTPRMDAAERRRMIDGWRHAVAAARTYRVGQ